MGIRGGIKLHSKGCKLLALLKDYKEVFSRHWSRRFKEGNMEPTFKGVVDM